MTENAIPARIRHLGVCAHPQTAYARRACRKAMLAATPTTVQAPAYAAGDRVELGDGFTALLGTRRGQTGLRWTAIIHDSRELECGQTQGYYPAAAEAVAAARRLLAGPRCSCGAPATMRASLRPACDDCYDRYAA